MNDTFSSMLVCLLAVVLILSFYAFFWLLKRGNHDELFPIAILCLGIPPLGILILFTPSWIDIKKKGSSLHKLHPSVECIFTGVLISIYFKQLLQLPPINGAADTMSLGNVFGSLGKIST